MNMKKIVAVMLALLMVAAFSACDTSSSDTDDKYVVGICQLTQHPALDAATKGFKDALVEEFGDKVVFEEKNANGDQNVCPTIIANLVSQKVDLIMANATPALTAAVNGTSEIPVLGTSITEYGTALAIEDFNGVVGGNVSGTSDLAPLDEQAQMIIDLFPNAKNVGLVYCSAEANSAYQVKVVKAYLQSKNIICTEYPFTDSNDVSVVAKNAADHSDVLYIPTDNTAADCAETINNVIGDVPAIVGEEGICAGCGVATLSISYYDLGVKTGKMAAKVLKGEADISTMKIEYVDNVAKKYNKAKCDQLGIDTAALEALGFVAIGE